MDRQRQGVPHLECSTHHGLKHMLPECFVSVKLETYEEGSSSEVQAYTIPQTTLMPGSHSQNNFNSNQSALLRESSCPKSSPADSGHLSKATYVLPPPSSSSSVGHQPQMTTTIMQQTQSSNQAQPAQQQQASAHPNEVSHVSQSERPSPQPSGPPSLSAAHVFGHPHSRPSEVTWLSHAYLDPATQHFHAQQMPYLSNDAALLTSVPQQQIQAEDRSRIVKQSVVSRGGPTSVDCGPDLTPSVTTVSAGDSHNNAFISYVLNSQRGMSNPGIFLLDASRGLPTESNHHTPSSGNQDCSNGKNNVDRPVDRVNGETLPDTASSSASPGPGERLVVSRSSQTIVTMSQIQDAPPMSDAKVIIIHPPDPETEAELEDSKDTVFSEADGEDSEGASSMEIECHVDNLRHVTNVASKCSDFGVGIKLSKRSQNGRNHSNYVTSSINNWNGSSKLSHDQCCELNGVPKAHVRDMKSKSQTPTSHKNDCHTNAGNSRIFLKENEKPFRCDVCGKKYPSHQALVNHDRYHRGERPYECETCHKAFATNSHLVTHRRTHTGERPYQCQICQRCFADRSAFVKHERTHGPNGSILKRYKCNECSSGFVDSCGLKKHIRIHTGERPYVCNVCQKTFSTSSTFVAHKRIHTGERPYNCESCDKMFITKSHLLTHRRTHTGEKPFTCPVCHRCFADGSSFRRHERLHTGDHRHICMQCGRGFSSESSLEKHKQTHVQSNSFSYVNVYENTKDLTCLTAPQPQQSCDSHVKATSRVSILQVRETSPLTVGSEVQVNGGSMCSVVSRKVESDNQSNHNSRMIRPENGLVVSMP